MLLLAGLLSSLPISHAQRTPNETLVLADCGISQGTNGGPTSREMLYCSSDVWTGLGLDTWNPTAMINVPWSGSYPWVQAGGNSTTMPNGDVFSVFLDRNVKDPDPAGDAWHKFEDDRPLKSYSHHWDKVFRLADGKWCSSTYVCNHPGQAYVAPPTCDEL